MNNESGIRDHESGIMKKKKRKIKIRKPKKTRAKPKPKSRAVNFLAPEFVYYKKGAGWYFVIGIFGLATLAIAIWQRMWLMAVVIFLATIVFFQYSKHKPKSKKCHISEKEIIIDDKKFPISQFKSFSIYLDESVSHLFLERVGKLQSSIWLNVKNKDLKRVTGVLLKLLPLKEHHYRFMANFNRWFRF